MKKGHVFLTGTRDERCLDNSNEVIYLLVVQYPPNPDLQLRPFFIKI